MKCIVHLPAALLRPVFKWVTAQETLIAKTFLVMRLTVLLFFLATFGVQASGFTQGNVSLNVQNMPVKDFLTLLKKQTGVPFIYNMASLKDTRPVTLKVKDIPLTQILDMCLKEQGLEYEMEKGYIIIRKKANDNLLQRLGSALFTDTLINVKGKVVDEKGAPVAATVRIKGADKYTSTNDAGEFVINDVKENDVLQISGINILPYEIKPGKKSNITIVAQSKITELDSVSVTFKTGYQNISKERATGSFVHLDNKIINRVPTTDILSRIQGVAAGVQITSSADDYGSKFTQVQVRGLSTIQANNQPLIVYDNFPFEGDLKSINPNDIEDITILKDAAAASIWGARSGNGVIVITSKKGHYNQAPKVTVTSNVSIANKKNLQYVPIISSADYVNLEAFLYQQGFYQSAITSPLMPALTPAVEVLLKASAGTISSQDSTQAMNALKSTDVRDELSRHFYQASVAQQYAVNIAGGGNNQQYFMSIGYDKNTGNLVNNKYDRVTINANNTFQLLKNKLELSTSIWYAKSKNTSSLTGPNITYPYFKVADANGNALRVDRYRRQFIDTIGNGQLLNWQYYPLNELQYNSNNVDGKTMRLGIDLKYRLIKGIEASAKYLYENGDNNTNIYYPVESYFARDLINLYSSFTTGKLTRAIPLGGILDYSYNKYYSNNIRGQLNFNFSDKQYGQFNAIAGAEIRETEFTGITNRAYGYDQATGISGTVDLVNAYPTIIDGNYNNIPNLLYFSGNTDRNVSLFANAAYSFQRKYTFTASARKDGSNQFGVSTNNKWSPLWSTGFSWEISNERFYHINWLPYLKFRTTFGYQGNVDKTVAAQLTTSISTNNKWQQNTATIRNLPNTNLRWEKTSITNIGIDFATPRNIISGSVEYYYKSGKDLMGVAYLPPSSGQTSYRANTANLTGSGWDITVNTRNISGKIAWQTKILLSYNTDKITNYKIPISNIAAFVANAGAANPVEGNAVNALYAYDFAGLDPATGAPLGTIKGSQSKDYTSIVNSSDVSSMKYQGRIVAPYFGSILNSVQLYNFEFSFNIVCKFGHVFRRPSINYTNTITQNGMGNSDYGKRWQKPGDEKHTTVPAFIYPLQANSDVFYNYSSVLTEKADFIRLQDARISYSLPKFFNTNIFKQLDVYATGSNLGLLWAANKQKLDPEYLPVTNSFYSKPSKLFSLGVKATF